MKITAVIAASLSYRRPEGKTMTMGIGSTIQRDAAIVRVKGSKGVTGYGEAHPSRSPGAVASAALPGIDMVLWDIRGKAANMPLYKLLGGSKRRVPVCAGGIALGYQQKQALAQEAKECVARGYKALKLRIGDNVKDDIERLRYVRHALGLEINILTDTNTAYTMADVHRVRPVLAATQADWLEEPVACNDFGSYREVAKITPLVPIGAVAAARHTRSIPKDLPPA